MATLERAIEIAVLVHKGTVDKAGQPYLLHPLRLMMRVETETEKIVAVLHDVVEDSQPHPRWGFDALRREGFSGSSEFHIHAGTFMALEPPSRKARISRLSGEFGLRLSRRRWRDCRSPRDHEQPSDSNARNAHRLKASGRLRSAATAQLSGRSSNRPGWNGSNALCSSRKKSAFVLPFRFPFNVWQSNA